MSEGSEKKLLMLGGHLTPATTQMSAHVGRKVWLLQDLELADHRVEWALGKIPS